MILYLLIPLFFCIRAFGQEGIVTAAYYDYSSEELSTLETLPTDFVMSMEALHKWDQLILKFAKDQEIKKEQLYRMYAYVYTAQRDAATLAHDIKGDYVGSLDPITLSIFQLFFPFFTPPFPLEEDLFSLQLSQKVFPNFKKRFLIEEKKIRHQNPLHIFYWTGSTLEFGEATLAWTPWVLSPIAAASIASTTSHEEWHLFSQKLAKGENWMNITNEFLATQKLPFEKTLLVRSIIAIALYDAIITNAKLKYIYGVENRNLLTEESPLHITLGYTVFSLLHYFFPEGITKD